MTPTQDDPSICASLKAEIDELRKQRDQNAHVIVESGTCPGFAVNDCRCNDCREVATRMAAAGYLDNVRDPWWEVAEEEEESEPDDFDARLEQQLWDRDREH